MGKDTPQTSFIATPHPGWSPERAAGIYAMRQLMQQDDFANKTLHGEGRTQLRQWKDMLREIEQEGSHPASEIEQVRTQIVWAMTLHPLFRRQESFLPWKRLAFVHLRDADLADRAVRGILPNESEKVLQRRLGRDNAQYMLALARQRYELVTRERKQGKDMNGRAQFFAETQRRRERTTLGQVGDLLTPLVSTLALVPTAAIYMYQMRKMQQGVPDGPFNPTGQVDIPFHKDISLSFFNRHVTIPIGLPKLTVPIPENIQSLINVPNKGLLLIGGLVIAITALAGRMFIENTRTKYAVRALEKSFNA